MSNRAPTGLMCELLTHPEATVITSPRPVFGWTVNDPRRGAVQTAFQVIVASSKDAVERCEPDLWDSGKVASDQSINVPYEGRPLPANSTCWWAVRTWDADERPGPWSAPQRINIGQTLPDEPFYSERWIKLDSGSAGEMVRANRHALEVHSIPPKEIVYKGPGHFFVDFGRAAFANLSLRLTSEVDGHEVEVRVGEKRANAEWPSPPNPLSRNQERGGYSSPLPALGEGQGVRAFSGDVTPSVETEPGGSVVYLKQVLKLKRGTHVYRLDLPRCEYGARMPEHIGEVRPFRYCEVVNSPSDIGIEDIAQLAVFSRFDDGASSFTCSDPTLNDVWELCKYSIKATSFLGIYVDGQRERLPYEADVYINQLGHYCVDREYAIARYTHEHLIHHPTWPTEWILFSVLIAWADYMYTGDASSIIRCYDDLKAKTLVPLAREDGLISTRTGLMTQEVLDSVHFKGKELRDIVDWPQGSESDGYVFTAINTVVNAFHYRALALMARMAEVAGRSDDAAVFTERARRVYDAFNEKLFDSGRGVYTDGEDTDHASLHANMFALAMGLVSEERKPSVVEFIKSRGMACSVYGAQFLLEALYAAGEDEAALKLMTDRGDRSWPHMIYDIGSTITLEAWDPKYKPNLDWNHAWGAAPANIIPRLLVGVEPIEPGFRRTRIRPQIGPLTDVSAQVPTVRGTVGVSIKRDAENYRLRCRIPVNMTAEVHLPVSDPSQVTESAGGASYLGLVDGRAVFAVGAGIYEFCMRMKG